MTTEKNDGPCADNARPIKRYSKFNGYSIADARDALNAIPSDIDRATWVRIGMAAQVAGLKFEDFDQWSAPAANYHAGDCRSTWNSFHIDCRIRAGTLYAWAKKYGWRARGHKFTQKSAPKATRMPSESTFGFSEFRTVGDVWNRCEPATGDHPYIRAKGAVGVPLDNLRVVPAPYHLKIARHSVVGWLVAPAHAPDGTLQSLQFIPPPGAGIKLNLPGASMAGTSFTVGTDGPVYLCEGVASAWSCWKATGHRAVCCFGWGNVGKVTRALRQREASAKLVICPDVGKESDADKIAAEVGAAVVRMPEGWAQNSDVNDYAQAQGHDALATLLEGAKAPPIEYPLLVTFADELSDTFTPPDEIIQGVLTTGDGSVLYGDANGGKTFLVIDMACAVARGVKWLGRKTEPGLVIYLAAESPSSVQRRLQAYQKHHNCKVPDFAIVQSPIDLFDGDDDTDKVIQLVQQLVAQRGKPVRLIVGDTLARLSAGANENAAQDMGLIVQRFDRIRTKCKAHFLLIHHSGKNAAAGARGWSGIRAAVDTEMEVTDSPTGRVCEITKQRDLATKGDRIGFRLEPVLLGQTKWGALATSCVVVTADAPDKPAGKRMGEVEGAVVEFLIAHKVGIKKADVVKHFSGRYVKGPVYRAMKVLAAAAVIHEAAGMVAVAEGAK